MVGKRVLIIAGGNKNRLQKFANEGKKLGLAVTIASFSELNFVSEDTGEFVLNVGQKKVDNFDLIYIFLVGKRLEEASILANYAREKGIQLVDKLYGNQHLLPSSISKGMETKLLLEAQVPMPKTFFAGLKNINRRAGKILGFPLVVKSTNSRKARDVWSPQTPKELDGICETLLPREKAGEHFFAQEFIYASQRIRVLVIGEEVVAAIERPTKWRKRFIKKVKGEYPEGIKGTYKLISSKLAEIAKKASSAVNLDIAGIDILIDDNIGSIYVIEANAAPSWKLVKKDTGINIEAYIMRYIRNILYKPSITYDHIKKGYQQKYKKFGYSPKSLSWKRLGASHQRFRQMWAEIDFNDKSVLDVGCGFGEMARFLKKRYKNVYYTGVDLVPEFIRKARKLYPEYSFKVANYFDKPLKEKFDVTIASGVLNSNVENNMEYRKKAIKIMFDHTDKLLAFNMLGNHPQPQNDAKSNVWYADSLEILDYCTSLSPRVILRANYHIRDFTVFLFKTKTQL